MIVAAAIWKLGDGVRSEPLRASRMRRRCELRRFVIEFGTLREPLSGIAKALGGTTNCRFSFRGRNDGRSMTNYKSRQTRIKVARWVYTASSLYASPLAAASRTKRALLLCIAP